MAKKIRGVETRHEQNQQQLLRDTRTIGKKLSDALSNPVVATTILSVLCALTLFYPLTAELVAAVSLGIFIFNMSRRTTLPFRVPKHANTKDYGDMKPNSKEANMARGITFFGNDIHNNDELWFADDDMRTHALIFGSTGSGKTQCLISIAYNSLLQGSGFIYVDGKGDNSLFAQMYSMTRSMGREDDLLLVNFMTGARDILGAQTSRLSNTINPFAVGSSSMLSQLVTSLMDSGSGGGDGDMWKGRAIAFVEALMRILTYMRDQGHILLDANSIRNYFILTKLESIVLDKKFPIDQRFVDIKDAPEIVTEPLYNYVINLPGFNPANKGRQAGEVLEQHGFITMQLTRVFSSLADAYGHIVRTNLAEVDFKDVVLNRRILITLLPALEKSPAELSNLGKLIVASLKAMMASGLGESVEGTYREVIERKPTTSPSPFVCILDEYGYYSVEGFAVVPAQARSLGFSAIFAGQDLPAFQKASKEEAASIGANTNIKICMKLEDPTDTLDFFMKTAGEAYVTTTSGFQTNASHFSNSYLDTKQAQVEKRSRIELLDLKDQDPGEYHIFFKSKIVRGRSFYAGPKPAPKLRLNQMLKVDIPPDEILEKIIKRIDDFAKVFKDPSALQTKATNEEELQFIIDTFNLKSKNSYKQQAEELFKRYSAKQKLATLEIEKVEEEKLAEGMNIFFTQDSSTKKPFDSHIPLLNKEYTYKQLMRVERILGKNKKDARNTVLDILKIIAGSTIYPPIDRIKSETAIVIKHAQELNKIIQEQLNKQESGGSATGSSKEKGKSLSLDDLDDLL